jgi:hypothetical protein
MESNIMPTKTMHNQTWDKDGNLLHEETVEVEYEEKDLEVLAAEAGITIPELLKKVQEYLQ